MSKLNEKHIQVTCAIIEQDGFVLAAQRSATMSLPLKWEFPGGKIISGETPEECLHREIDEELGIKITICKYLPLATHNYPAITVSLHPFICTIKNGEIKLNEHAKVIWLPPRKLFELDWAEADLPVLANYCQQWDY